VRLFSATLILILVAGSAVACSKQEPPPDPCQLRPTIQTSDGRWLEADGEELDDDPCDSDDYLEDGLEHKKPKPKKKTTPRR